MADPPVTYMVPGAGTSPKFAEAFSQGCHGQLVPVSRGLQPGAFAAFCTPQTWPLLRQVQDEGRDYYYGDHGCFRRGVYYRVTKNGYQPDGRGRAAPDRFRRYGVSLSDRWHTHGRQIVVCPNSPVYMRFHGREAHGWVAEVIRHLSRVTDRPVVTRWKVDSPSRPLALDLADAWMVVTFSSAAAVEALAAGIPVCTLAPWASTARMGITDLKHVESPHYPDLDDRDQFLFNLAAAQWTLSEIRQGLAWAALQGEMAHV